MLARPDFKDQLARLDFISTMKAAGIDIGCIHKCFDDVSASEM